MVGMILVGLGAVVFMLGLISLQLASMRQNGWLASAGVMVAFVCCALLGALLVVGGITTAV